MDLRDLRASLVSSGQLLPVLIWAGRTVDGAKREQLCAELGFPSSQRHARSLREACSILWLAHPERALELAGAGSLADVSELCGARPAQVAKVLAALARARRPPPEKRAPRRQRSIKASLLQLWIEPEARHYADKAATFERLTLSAFVRRSLWREANRILGRMPDAAPAWMQPRERRLPTDAGRQYRRR